MMNKLYIVPTPIGNLEDITLRALRILKEVDLVLAEDTRKTRILFNKYDIKTPVESYHKFNEHRFLNRYIEKLISGVCVALVSDAGTPSISDPGFLLVRECLKNNIEVECLPGPVAFIPALVNSGLPSDRFIFEGFLPQKKGRNKRLEKLKEYDCTIILYESPYRLIKTLNSLVEIFSPACRVCVTRELTKIYEENIRGQLKDVIQHFESVTPKGEIVIILNPSTSEQEEKPDDK